MGAWLDTTRQTAKIFDPDTGEEIRELRWPKPVDTLFIGFILPSAREEKQPPRPAAQARRRRGNVVQFLIEVARQNPRLREDCRKRFAAAFACFCAVEGVGLEECVKMFAEALGMDDVPREYYSVIKYRYSQCAKREKPLFSLRELLTCRSGEWYCIKECLTHIPRDGRPENASDVAHPAGPAEEQPQAEEEPLGDVQVESLEELLAEVERRLGGGPWYQ